jgi:predicted HAD superfamily Cof-like phosphohydrolase
VSALRNAVRQYHERFHPNQKEATPLTIPAELLAFRRRLHDEEVREVTEAWDWVEDRGWPPRPLLGSTLLDQRAVAHLLHELADLVIVAYGTAAFMDIDLEDVIMLVMQANMRKIPNPDPAGKALKPDGYVTADLAVLDFVKAWC